MKIGMIFECGPHGADKKVYEYLARQINPEIQITPITLDSKPKLVEHCGEQAKALLEIEGCEKILIIWDLCPPWKEKRARACRFNDCLLIRESLERAELTVQQQQYVHLICVEKELETWLLFDHQSIQTYLCGITRRPCRVRRIRNPEQYDNPKEKLYSIFQENYCRKYEDLKDAEKIIKLVDISRLRNCSSFVRFENKIRGA